MFVLFRDQFLFTLYFATLSILIFEYFCCGYLLTTIQRGSQTNAGISRFSIGFGLTDECFLVGIFITVAIRHIKFKILSFDRIQSVPLFAINFFYHLCFQFPMNLFLTRNQSAEVAMLLFCYSYQHFIVTTVVVNYSRALRLIRNELKVVTEEVRETDGSNLTAALQCHHKYSKLCQELSSRYSAFAILIVVHATIVVTIRSNIFLMYIFNEGYKSQSIWKLVLMMTWAASSFSQMSILLIASHRIANSWRSFVKQLANYSQSFNFRLLLLDDGRLMAYKFFKMDNEFLFKVRKNKINC